MNARAEGALIGLALGDALGMPTQMLTPARIEELFGRLEDFYPGPAESPVSPGQAKGTVTDDTEQALILARLLIDGDGEVDDLLFAQDLLAWHRDHEAAGSLDLLGPSTLRALTAFASGVSTDETGRWGDTNGAAMRVAPFGIAHKTLPLKDFVDKLARVNRLTHNTQMANAGSAAIAAAVSAGIEGASISDQLAAAVEASVLGETHGHATPGPSVTRRILWAIDLVDQSDDGLTELAMLVGNSVAIQESVPTALAIAWGCQRDPWLALRVAASLGGDSDTIAAMVGAVLGAHYGVDGFPPDAVAFLETANPTLDLRGTAAKLMELRG